MAPTPVLLPGKSHGRRSLVGCSPWGHAKSRTRLSDFTFTFHFHALEKEMATHSSVLAWRIPGTGEPGGLPSMGSHRVGHDWSDLAAAAVHNRTCRISLPWFSLCEIHVYSLHVQEILLFILPDFPGSSVVRTLPSNQEMGVQSLVGELRSHMPCGQKAKT